MPLSPPGASHDHHSPAHHHRALSAARTLPAEATALFVANDQMALGALRALAEALAGKGVAPLT